MELCRIFGPWVREFSLVRKILPDKNCDILKRVAF